MASEDIRVTLSADINDLQRAFKKATGEIDNFQKKVSGLDMKIPDVNTSTLQKSLNNASKQFNDIGDRSQRAGQRMQEAFVPAAAASSFAIFGMIQNSRDFEGAVRRASVLTQGSYEDVKSAVLDMASTSVYTTSEVADAMAEMGAKGFDASKAIDALPGVLSAAAASGEDLALTADTITSALNAFSLDASESGRVADILAQAANQSAAGILDMQYAFKYAAGPAAQLGYSVEDLAAAVGIMVDAGLSGETAGTTLRASLLRLVDPPSAAAKELKKLGIATRDQSGEMKPLAQLIDELQGSMGGYTNAQKAAALSTIFGVEAVSGMMSLMSAGPDEIRKMTKALEDSSGASAKAADAMLEGWAGALTKMESSVDSAARAFTDALAPAIQVVAEIVKGIADWFSALPQSMQTLIATMTVLGTSFLLLGAILGILINAWGGVAIAIGSVLAWVSKIIPLITNMGAIFAALTNPIGLIVLAIGSLVAAFIASYQNIEWFREGVKNAWEAIKNAFMTALNFIIGIVQTVMSEVSSFFGDQLAKVKALWDEHGAFIMSLVKGYLGQVWATIQMYMGFIQGIFQAVWPIISNVVKVAWELIKTVIGTTVDVIVGLIDAAMSLLQGDWEGAWDAIKGIAEDIWHNIEDFFSNIDLVQIGKDIIQGLIDGIGSMAGAVADRVSEMAGGIKDKVMDILGIHSPSRVMRDQVGKWIPIGLADGIDEQMRSVQTAANRMASTVIDSASLSKIDPQVSALVQSSATLEPASDEGPQIVNFERLFDGATINVREERDIKALAVELYNLQQNAKARKGVR